MLGYRLFVMLPEKVDSTGKIVLPGGISIWLSRVGPGLFFALFGAAIVAYSFASTVRVTSELAGAPGEAGAAGRQEVAAMSGRSAGVSRHEAREQRLVILGQSERHSRSRPARWGIA